MPIDLIDNALHGDALPLSLLVGCLVLGVAAYIGYGYRHSRLGLAEPPRAVV